MNIFILGSVISTIALAIFSLFKLSKTNTIKWIVYYCIAGAVIEIISEILALNGIKNIFLYYILVWVEIFFLIFYFITNSQTLQSAPSVWIFIPVFVILFTIRLFLDSSSSLCPFSGIFEGLLIFTLALITFNDELRSPKYSDILKEPYFWFVSSLIIYYGCVSILLIGAKVYAVDKKMFNYIWNYQNIINILKNILISIGFMLYRK